jgi:uncharacterized protein YicC (UPF0701 family)
LKPRLDPGLLIEEIVLHPHASHSFERHVRTMARRHVARGKVSRSAIVSRLW